MISTSLIAMYFLVIRSLSSLDSNTLILIRGRRTIRRVVFLRYFLLMNSAATARECASGDLEVDVRQGNKPRVGTSP